MNVVEQIHHEIDTAEDRLLLQARAVIQSYKGNDKAERLERIGFVGTDTVKQYNEKKVTVTQTKEQAELIEYYKQAYPFQKFLTEAELDRICETYGLIYAPISAYKKDVPEKNLSEIEQAKPLDGEHLPKDTRLLIRNNFKLFTPLWVRRALRKGIEIRDGYYSGWNRYCREYLKIDFDISDYETYDWSERMVKKQGLFIAAPRSHFNLKGIKKTSLFSFHVVQEVKDPIVFRYCKGGIQVLSKWGAEASDESTVNEKFN
jgi:hypothetical protein